MKDCNHMPLQVGDSIRTSVLGVLVIESLIAPDNQAGHGELVRTKNTKGSRVDIRLKVAGAVFAPQSQTYNGIKRAGGVR